jgi:phosphate-selective porin OprO/OprP
VHKLWRVVACCMLGLLVVGSLSTPATANENTEARLRALEQTVQAQAETIRSLESALDESAEQTSAVEAALAEYSTGTLAFAEKSGGNGDLHLHWSKGIRAKSGDKAFSLKFGGRAQFDGSWYNSSSKFKDYYNSGREWDPYWEFRRVRFYFAGTLYKYTYFKAQIDFAGEKVRFKDVYIGIQHIPVLGHLQVGQFKMPFGLDTLTSSNYLTFIERSLVHDAFAPDRQYGAAFFDAPEALDEMLYWQVGLHYRDVGGGMATGEHLMYAVRVALTPWFEEKGQHLFHIGIGYIWEDPTNSRISFASMNETHGGPTLFSTGTISSVRVVHYFGVEAAFQYGPFHAQAEYQYIMVDVQKDKDPRFFGWYIQGGWFITGESRGYKRSSATWSRAGITDNLNFEDGGMGAWEIALRYSALDLTDRVDGGKGWAITGGVNWYLNPNVKIQFNYVHTKVDEAVGNPSGSPDGKGEIGAFVIRFHVDW